MVVLLVGNSSRRRSSKALAFPNRLANTNTSSSSSSFLPLPPSCSSSSMRYVCASLDTLTHLFVLLSFFIFILFFFLQKHHNHSTWSQPSSLSLFKLEYVCLVLVFFNVYGYLRLCLKLLKINPRGRRRFPHCLFGHPKTQRLHACQTHRFAWWQKALENYLRNHINLVKQNSD